MRKSSSSALAVLLLGGSLWASCKNSTANTSSATKSEMSTSIRATEAKSVKKPPLSLISDKQKDGLQSINVALLLDTSNSMDGLIDQAKSQLWNIINELANAKTKEGKLPKVQIALYDYGNSKNSITKGYVRQVNALTTDLDLISESLFGLKTSGGNEYCGQVIQTALDDLDWGDADANDVQLIFIAGNEGFDQGDLDYKDACKKAKKKGIVIHTIFCGVKERGVKLLWKDGADCSNGTYMNIQQDKKTVHIDTPYDDQIENLNKELNKTYVYYGSKGVSKKALQMKQDQNANRTSKAYMVKRAVSKSSKLYKNSSWDLVDATEDESFAMESIAEESLPDDLKGMSVEQRKDYVEQKAKERKDIQKQINQINIKRRQYIKENQPKKKKDNSLEKVMLESIRKEAASKEISF